MNARLVLAVAMQAVGYVLIGAGVALLAPQVANATIINGVNGASIEYVSGGARIMDGSGTTFQGRTWDIPSSRTVRATDTGAPLRLGGKDININAARTMTPIAIQRAAAIALKAIAPVSVGIELWQLYDEVRVRPGTCAEGGLPSSVSDVLCFDAGTVQENATVYYPNGGGLQTTCRRSSPREAAQCWGNSFAIQDSSTSDVLNGSVYCSTGASDTACPQWQQSHTRCSKNTITGDLYGCSTLTPGVVVVAEAATQCPASIDASNPANNIPEGMPVGPDGKCRTGRYNTPLTPPQAADKLETHAPPTGDELRRMAEDAIARGQGIEASPRIVSGPTTAPGAPTTTTTQNPDATTTTTTKTPTTHYTYNNNTVNYTISTTTVVNNAGDVTTTTENAPPPEEDTDACKANPDLIICKKLGNPPTDAPSWQTINVPWAAEDLGVAGSCPPENNWQVGNIALSWGYEPVCDVAPQIRIALLLMATIGAIGIIFKETQS